MTVEPLRPADGDRLARTLDLAHLLACLRRGVALMDEAGLDVDARIIEAHTAQLAAGREWPGSGDPITPPVLD